MHRLKPFLILATTCAAVVAHAADLAGFPPTETPYGYIAPATLSDINVSDGESQLFRPWFHNDYDYGDLQAHAVTAGGEEGDELWSAATQLEAQVASGGWSSRQLFTNSGGSGSLFGCASATDPIQRFHCGDHSVEDGTSIRLREYISSGATSSFTLGDIIHSPPQHVATPKAAFPDDAYMNFAQAWKNRSPRVYVGANDGFLHAFDAATGNEVWAYTPQLLSGKLASLASPSYSHQYYVDGPLVVHDARADFYGDGNEWRSILVSALGAGGQGLFALDVTDPNATNRKNDLTTSRSLATKFLWEFTASDDSDLGYTYGTPIIAKLASGGWGVVAANGYDNGGDGKSHLFVLDLASGSILADIPLDDGSASANGLSTPAVVDTDNDGVADRVYAGDLNGNLWRLNIGNADPSQWAATATRLFTATDSHGNSQPILTAPQVARTPGGTLYVTFATGDHLKEAAYLTSGLTYPDANYHQSIYGLVDDGTISSPQSRSDLASPIGFSDISGTDYRTIAANTPTARGWVVDLGPEEHLLQEMTIRDDRLQMMINDRTAGAPKNWLTQISFKTGGLPDETVFDLNSDSVLDSNDDQGSPAERVVAINKSGDLASRPIIARISGKKDVSLVNRWHFNSAPTPEAPAIDGVSCSKIYFEVEANSDRQRTLRAAQGNANYAYSFEFIGYLTPNQVIRRKVTIKPCEDSNCDDADENIDVTYDPAGVDPSSGAGSGRLADGTEVSWDGITFEWANGTDPELDGDIEVDRFDLRIKFESPYQLANYRLEYSNFYLDRMGDGIPMTCNNRQIREDVSDDYMVDGQLGEEAVGMSSFAWGGTQPDTWVEFDNHKHLVFNPDSPFATDGSGPDSDNDGVHDNVDYDDDNDGIYDHIDSDANGNGIPDIDEADSNDVTDGSTDTTVQSGSDFPTGRIRWRELTF